MARGLNYNHVLWIYEKHIRDWRREGLTLRQIKERLEEEYVMVSTQSISNVLKGRGY